MIKTIVTFLFLVNSFFLSGQGGDRDNLLYLLANSKDDTNKIKVLLDIERNYFSSDIDSALYYNKLCEALIFKINAQQYKHDCFHDFVKIYHAKTDYKNALEYCLKSIETAKQNNNKFQEAISYRAIFNIYHNLNMNDSAVKYAVHSLNLTMEIGDTANITTNYGNLCWLYLDLNQYDKAVDYGIKGIESGERYADTVGLLISINNLALCYLRMNNNNKAIELFKKQLAIGKQINRARSVRNAIINLATAYFYTGDAKGLESSATLLNEYNNKNSELDNKNRCLQYITNAYNYIFQMKFQKAEKQLFLGMEIAKKDSLIDPLLTIYITLSKLKFAQHDFVSGNFYEEKWDSLSQTLTDKQLSEYATELEKKYEVAKKEIRIHHLEVEKQVRDLSLQKKSVVNGFLVGGIIALTLISFLTYRNFMHKHKLQQIRISELETEKQLEVTEGVLKGEELERTRIAKDLHDGLGGMLSGIKYSFNTMKENLIMTPENHQAFERSMDMLDSSIKEMRRVAHNMMPEALVQFGLNTAVKDFCNDITKSGVLNVDYHSVGLEDYIFEQTASITIYRIIQELLNNTIKHANATSAIVQLIKTREKITFTVEDNGKGFDTSILNASKGIGWINIKNRIGFLKGTLDVTSRQGEGTSVQIELNS
jgi:two-component system NarL family sensor kinase